MNTIYSILVSDGIVALHFLLTMVLLAVVILRGIQAEMKVRRLTTENFDLKRQLGELSDFTSGTVQELRAKVGLQSDAICHTADYLTGSVELDVSRFKAVQECSLGAEALSGPELISVDLVGEPIELDLPSAESAIVAPDQHHLEPDVSMPLRAALITMPSPAPHTDDMIYGSQETIDNRSDLMTRVLQQSRGQ